MKRFYKDASVTPAEDGLRVLLDGRAVRTPAGNALALPTRALAEAIAAEWAGQGEEITPAAMPLLRLANTAIDGVTAQRDAVIAAILRFGENDLLCYRADRSTELAARQAQAWDPLLAWARDRHGAGFVVVDGITHEDQPLAALAALRVPLETYDAFALAALHVTASITGSAVLALALAAGEINAARAFALSRVDEDFQAATWGRDEEAEVRAAALAREMETAAQFLAASRA